MILIHKDISNYYWSPHLSTWAQRLFQRIHFLKAQTFNRAVTHQARSIKFGEIFIATKLRSKWKFITIHWSQITSSQICGTTNFPLASGNILFSYSPSHLTYKQIGSNIKLIFKHDFFPFQSPMRFFSTGICHKWCYDGLNSHICIKHNACTIFYTESLFGNKTYFIMFQKYLSQRCLEIKTEIIRLLNMRRTREISWRHLVQKRSRCNPKGNTEFSENNSL